MILFSLNIVFIHECTLYTRHFVSKVYLFIFCIIHVQERANRKRKVYVAPPPWLIWGVNCSKNEREGKGPCLKKFAVPVNIYIFFFKAINGFYQRISKPVNEGLAPYSGLVFKAQPKLFSSISKRSIRIYWISNPFFLMNGDHHRWIFIRLPWQA